MKTCGNPQILLPLMVTGHLAAISNSPMARPHGSRCTNIHHSYQRHPTLNPTVVPPIWPVEWAFIDPDSNAGVPTRSMIYPSPMSTKKSIKNAPQ